MHTLIGTLAGAAIGSVLTACVMAAWCRRPIKIGEPPKPDPEPRPFNWISD